MRFAEITGHEDLKKGLVSMAESGRVPHAMLFYENEGCGALALALAFVQYLDGTEEDSEGELPGIPPEEPEPMTEVPPEPETDKTQSVPPEEAPVPKKTEKKHIPPPSPSPSAGGKEEREDENWGISQPELGF